MLDLVESNEAVGWWNTQRPLTHSSDLSREGLAVHATQTCSVDGCERPVQARTLCNPHYKSAQRSGTLPPKMDMLARSQQNFWSNVAKTADCWVWQGSLTVHGYGQFGYARGKTGRAHKLAWEWQNGPVPDGLVLDHLCRNRACVRPEHLEPVTPRTNALRGIGPSAINSRKRFCKRNHEFTADNTIIDSEGKRQCRECARAYSSAWGKAKRRAALCGAPTRDGKPCAHPVAAGKRCRFPQHAVLHTPENGDAE
jgi:hypothetical protein